MQMENSLPCVYRMRPLASSYAPAPLPASGASLTWQAFVPPTQSQDPHISLKACIVLTGLAALTEQRYHGQAAETQAPAFCDVTAAVASRSPSLSSKLIRPYSWLAKQDSDPLPIFIQSQRHIQHCHRTTNTTGQIHLDQSYIY